MRWDGIPEVAKALKKIEEMVILLENHTSGGSSGYLKSALNKISEEIPFVRKEEFVKIQTLCHPKAFGDLHVDRISFDVWWNHVEELGKACGEAFEALDKHFDTLSEEERLKKG